MAPALAPDCTTAPEAESRGQCKTKSTTATVNTATVNTATVNTATSVTTKAPPTLQTLPEDILSAILLLLPQASIAHLSSSCTVFNKLAKPLLQRTYRCVTCTHALFHPRDTIRPPVQKTRRKDCQPAFFSLTSDAQHNLRVDDRRGAANFHVLRHLTQTVFRNVRFPLPEDLQAVRALRCPNCSVFVGFRHTGATGTPREYIHSEFVELVNAASVVVTPCGRRIANAEGVVRCSDARCGRVLFSREDIQPWTHVLASSRLTDMDAYLEWDHSWAGVETAGTPAFFVKRLRSDCSLVCNARTERLRQGVMRVADVHCSGCEAQIGWKILAEVPESSEGLLHNYDQIGRFGIIRSAVTPSEPRYLV